MRVVLPLASFLLSLAFASGAVAQRDLDTEAPILVGLTLPMLMTSVDGDAPDPGDGFGAGLVIGGRYGWLGVDMTMLHTEHEGPFLVETTGQGANVVGLDARLQPPRWSTQPFLQGGFGVGLLPETVAFSPEYGAGVEQWISRSVTVTLRAMHREYAYDETIYPNPDEPWGETVDRRLGVTSVELIIGWRFTLYGDMVMW